MAATTAERSHAHDFFVSYRSVAPDRDWAQWIAWHLETQGYKVLIQAWDFAPGKNLVALMHEGVESWERTILVLSPRYFGSDWTGAEWTAVFAKDPMGREGRILPFRTEAFDVPGLLGSRAYVDLFDLPESQALERLQAALVGDRLKPTTAPPFPGVREALTSQAPRFPGALPPFWKVPFSENRNFVGRDDLLRDLEQHLAQGKTTVLTQVLKGLGGVGKTQTAVEYAYRHRARYRIVWWIAAETEATLAAAYAELGRRLGVPVADERNQALLVQATRERLQAETEWLLVFDNADDPRILRPYLPAAGGGHVLVTSRSHDWRDLATPLDVAVFPPDDAVAFLLKRTGQDDAAAARALAEELGRLPLALAQAAGYIHSATVSLADYLRLYRQNREALWKRETPPLDYPTAVAETWDLSFQRLQETAPHALHVLHLLAFLAPDDVPRTLLRDAAPHLPPDVAPAFSDELELNANLGHIHRLGLVTVTPEAVSLHRVLQLVVRDRLKDAQKTWLEIAANLMARVFTFDSNADSHRIAAFTPLLPHARAVAEDCERENVALPAGSVLLDRVGTYFQMLGHAHEGQKSLERALRINERTYGPNHPTVATRLSNLSMVLKDLGDAAAAKVHLERALRIGEKAYGADHPIVATCLSNLSMVLRDLGDVAAAKVHLERALRIDEKTNGADHPTVAIDLSNLSMVLRDLGDVAAAKVHLERALRIDEKTYGVQHPSVAICLGNLALVVEDKSQARALLQRALSIFLHFYDETHPSVLETRRRLARLDERGG